MLSVKLIQDLIARRSDKLALNAYKPKYVVSSIFIEKMSSASIHKEDFDDTLTLGKRKKVSKR